MRKKATFGHHHHFVTRARARESLSNAPLVKKRPDSGGRGTKRRKKKEEKNREREREREKPENVYFTVGYPLVPRLWFSMLREKLQWKNPSPDRCCARYIGYHSRAHADRYIFSSSSSVSFLQHTNNNLTSGVSLAPWPSRAFVHKPHNNINKRA